MNKRVTRGDRIFQWCINGIAILIACVTLYPLLYVLAASLSEPLKILSGEVVLWPVGLNVNSYRRVFASADIINGYKNTIIYATSGTVINLLLTICAAYPLSMPDLKGKNFVTFLITFTMFFSGGMIPSYLNIRSLGLLDTVWSVLLPGAINATNMLIMRNYFTQSIPAELREAASIDGCSPFRTMLDIILPLSKSILIVITLYYFVGHWNSYFDAMMYLRKREMMPLQVLLRQILIMSQMGDMAETYGVDDANTLLLYESLKYAIIVISAVPLLVIYPMIQKFFEKGIMMGSIKG